MRNMFARTGRRVISLLLCTLALIWGGVGLLRAASASPEVIVVPIEGTIDEGMAHLVVRAVDEANDSHAAALVLDINTPGGLVSSAFDIRDALFRARVPTLAYVAQRAFSAGALVTLSAQRIVMAPGASLGAAEPIPKTVKTVAALRSEFAATAARNHRDPLLASAMVDANVNAPPYKRPGAILSLTADEARRARYTDAIEPSLTDALRFAKLERFPRHTVSYTFAENLARFASGPEVSGLLLSLGFMGLLIEMQTLHGIAGLIGISSLALFFGAHAYAGFSDATVIALAILGVIGILLELHVLPGQGFFGTLGIVALLAAVVLAFGSPTLWPGIEALSIAILLSGAMFWLFTRIWPGSAFMRRLTLTAAQGSEYVAGGDLTRLRGRSGRAASILRPSGTAIIEGERVSVLSEGEFIEAGAPVRVIRVEGSRVFVAPLEPPP